MISRYATLVFCVGVLPSALYGQSKDKIEIYLQGEPLLGDSQFQIDRTKYKNQLERKFLPGYDIQFDLGRRGGDLLCDFCPQIYVKGKNHTNYFCSLTLKNALPGKFEHNRTSIIFPRVTQSNSTFKLIPFFGVGSKVESKPGIFPGILRVDCWYNKKQAAKKKPAVSAALFYKIINRYQLTKPNKKADRLTNRLSKPQKPVRVAGNASLFWSRRSNLALKVSPNVNARTVAVVPFATKLLLLSQTNPKDKWVRVMTALGRTGFVHQEDITDKYWRVK